jgi:hypothetical protein
MDPNVQAALISAVIGGAAVLIAAGLSMITALRERAKTAEDNRERDDKNAERQLEVERRLASLNADIRRQADEDSAKRDYNYEALKRLYAEVNPLLFQSREYCEGSAWRIRRIVCGQILVADGDHLLTSAQRICAPLVVAQELQRHLTAVDLRWTQSFGRSIWCQRNCFGRSTQGKHSQRFSPPSATQPNRDSI